MREKLHYVGTPSDVVEEIRVQSQEIQNQFNQAFREGNRQKLMAVVEDKIALNRTHLEVVKEIIVLRKPEKYIERLKR